MEFGPYILGESIGEGGYATVHLAHDGAGRPVALKVLKESFLGNAAVRSRFAREARLQACVAHEGVLGCRGLVRDGLRLAIALEYFPSSPLRPVTAEGEELGRALAILYDVGAALSCLHGRRIVHCDLKPGNILVNERGCAKIIDFGLAYRQGFVSALLRRLGNGAIQGSPSYMAPEVIRGEAPDPRADLYSLGVVAYYALTGKLPFAGSFTRDVLRKQVEATPVAPTRLNPAIPRAVELLIFRLLAKEKGRRLASAELFCRELHKSGVRSVRPCVASA